MTMNWNGAFTPPLRKHRLYTGEVANHIEVESITQLDDDEQQELLDDFENAESDLVMIGDGGIAWLIRVGFIGGDALYEYVILADEEPSVEEAKALIAEELSD